MGGVNVNQTYIYSTHRNYFMNSTGDLFINKEGDLLIYYRFEYGK